jgi:hypothetical protein
MHSPGCPLHGHDGRMATTVPHAKFLFTDLNPADVVPVSIDDLLTDGEPRQLLRDPHPDYPGAWRYEGMDGDSYVYRELLENTVVGAQGYSGQSADEDGTPARAGETPPLSDESPSPRG